MAVDVAKREMTDELMSSLAERLEDKAVILERPVGSNLQFRRAKGFPAAQLQSKDDQRSENILNMITTAEETNLKTEESDQTDALEQIKIFDRMYQIIDDGVLKLLDEDPEALPQDAASLVEKDLVLEAIQQSRRSRQKRDISEGKEKILATAKSEIPLKNYPAFTTEDSKKFMQELGAMISKDRKTHPYYQVPVQMPVKPQKIDEEIVKDLDMSVENSESDTKVRFKPSEKASKGLASFKEAVIHPIKRALDPESRTLKRVLSFVSRIAGRLRAFKTSFLELPVDNEDTNLQNLQENPYQPYDEASKIALLDDVSQHVSTDFDAFLSRAGGETTMTHSESNKVNTNYGLNKSGTEYVSEPKGEHVPTELPKSARGVLDKTNVVGPSEVSSEMKDELSSEAAQTINKVKTENDDDIRLKQTQIPIDQPETSNAFFWLPQVKSIRKGVSLFVKDLLSRAFQNRKVLEMIDNHRRRKSQHERPTAN